MARSNMWLDYALQQVGTASFRRLEQLIAAIRGRAPEGKENEHLIKSRDHWLGRLVDWLDLHCVSDGHQLRLRNADAGNSELVKIVSDREALVYFKATGGHESA